MTQNPVFCHKVGVAQAEFLIDGTGSSGEQLFPVHGAFHQHRCPSVVVSMGHNQMGGKM